MTPERGEGLRVSSEPGRLTAAMRLAPAGRQVLRIARVEQGRIVDERLLSERVVVGRSEKATFVLQAREAPARHTLFQRKGSVYLLRPHPRMRGRITRAGRIVDLDELREDGSSAALTLDAHARGKIELAGATFLFQLVAAPLAIARPALPRAVIEPAVGFDPKTTVVAAFSFLLHFLAVGALYSDWVDPVVDEAVTVSGLVDSLPLPVVPLERADAAQADQAKPGPTSATPKKDRARLPGGVRPSGATAAKLKEELDRIELVSLGALVTDRPATAGVLRDGRVPTSALDEAAKSGNGVSDGTPSFLASRGGVPLRPGELGGTLADLGNRRKSVATDEHGSVVRTRGPIGHAAPILESTTSHVSNAASVIARMRGGFSACYRHALDQYPDAQGGIRLAIRVGPGGEVSGVSGAPSGNIPASLQSCVAARARSASFEPPEGGSALVVVPVSFVKQ